MIRYRTESFSGTGNRNAAEVMAFETYELGNTDILQTLTKTILKDCGDISEKCIALMKKVDNEGIDIDDDFSFNDCVLFYRKVLHAIQEVTGCEIKYALWLADKDAVTNKDFYGRHMIDGHSIDAYETGPVVLSDIGYDGTLYGYTEFPVAISAQ